jgi:hypothetical protein
MNGVTKLGGMNFAKWKADIQMILAIMDRDHSFREDKPVEPVAEGDNDTSLALWKVDHEKAKAQWERSDRVVFMIMDNAIDPTIRGALPKTAENAKTFMAKIEEYFKVSSKANASIYSWANWCRPTMMGVGMCVSTFLRWLTCPISWKDLECPLLEPYVIHYIMISLPPHFGNFKINYSSSDKKWNTAELIANLSQEEERLRTENGKHIVNFGEGSNSGHVKSRGKFSHQKGKGKSLMTPKRSF